VGHIRDRWTDPVEGSRRRVKNDRYGKGKRWQARWTEPDGRERVLACSTKDEAEAVLLHAAVGDIRPRPKEVVRFGDYAEQWRRERLHHRASSADKIERMFRLYLIPTLGGLPLASVTRVHVQDAVIDWSGRIAATSVHQAYGYVRSIFKTALEDRVVDVSPCVRINLPERVRDRIVPLTAEQVQVIRDAMPDWYRALVTVGAATGMRQGEMCGLTEDRIIGDNEAIKIDRQRVGANPDGSPVFGPPKSKNGYRTVDLGAVGSAALAAHREAYVPGPDGLVFTTQDGLTITRIRMGKAWRAAIEGMDMRNRSGWHELRHFNASALIAANLSVRAVADRLGDRPDEILKTYAHLWPTDQARATSALDKLLGE
jgi:integrase